MQGEAKTSCANVEETGDNALELSDVEDVEQMADTEKRIKEQPPLLTDHKQRKLSSLSDREQDPKNKKTLEEAHADSEASVQQPSAVVMQPSERSLRRTARVKTGK